MDVPALLGWGNFSGMALDRVLRALGLFTDSGGDTRILPPAWQDWARHCGDCVRPPSGEKDGVAT